MARGGVVKTVVNDDGSFWRQYSDGFIEQGGYLAKTNKTITLPKAFSSKPLTLVAVAYNATRDNVGYAQIYDFTTTSFFIRTKFEGSTYGEACYWYAAGY